MNLSEPFIRRPVMTVVLTVSAILFGVLAVWQLPVNDLPAVDYPVIQVTCGYPGASPNTVAANIATPLERQFMQIPGLELITSKSTQGFCNFILQFALTKSIDAAATDVQAAISRAQGSLPVDLPSPPTFSKTNPNDQPILYVALMSDSMTQGQIYDLANTQVGQRISILSGVSQFAIYGTKSAVRIKARSIGAGGAEHVDRRSDDGGSERDELSGRRPVRRAEPLVSAPAAGTTQRRRRLQQPDHRLKRTARRFICVTSRRRRHGAG